MKQSAKAITFTGLAGAAAFAGATQSYGTIVNLTPPSNIAGVAPNTGASSREFYDVDTGKTSATKTSASDLEFGYLNSSTYNESFTGIYGLNGAKSTAYYASSGSSYAYGLAKGTLIGTGGAYAFNQTTGHFTFLSLVYNGTPYGIQSPNTPEYVGFEFTAADGLVHNGWLELESVSTDGATLNGGLEFLGAAYNSVAGATILAGQTTSAAVPEPGTLAALAAGAAVLGGIGLQRRRRQAATAV